MKHPPEPASQRILIVDDNPLALDVTRWMLARAGYTVACADSGEEALRQVESFQPDLVLLDVVLPDLMGPEVLARIRGHPASSNTTVVFLSALQAAPEEQAAGLDAGAEGYIARPISNHELLARVRMHLRQHHLAATLRASERALLASHRQVLELAEAMPQIVWMADPQGNNLCMNQRWIDHAGVGPKARFGQDWLQFVHPEDLPRTLEAWQRAVEGGADFVVECRLRNAQAQYRWMLTRGMPQRDQEGRVLRWIGTCTDIDDLKRAEQARADSEAALRTLSLELEAQRARLEAAQAVAKVGSWETDLDTLAVSWSAETHRIFDTSPVDFSPTHEAFLVFVHPDDRASVDAAFKRSLEEGGDGVIAHRVVTAAGQLKHVEERWQVVSAADGTPLRAIGTCQDITERVRLEERLLSVQRLDAVGQLTGGLAHDFNNLLTVILGNAEMLREQLASQPQLAPLADMVVSAAERGSQLTQRLLAFARRQALAPQALNVQSQLEGLAPLLQRTVGEAVQMSVSASPDLWSAMVDPAQLDEALLNLCMNARDAMPMGGQLRIDAVNEQIDDAAPQARPEGRHGAYVRLTVADSGSGIAPAHLPRVFEPFFTTKERDKGTGLGLAMVYGFVKQSGGHIDISSQPGRGTTVTLYLPRALSAIPASAAAVAHAPTNADAGTILLVEDEDLVRRYAVGQLVALGYRVLEASGGPPALNILRSSQPVDLLFTDVVMPVMSGRELADEAVRLRPGLCVLYTSGYSENAIVHDGRLDAGVQLLTKPYRREELARHVRAALATRAPP